MCGIAGYLNFNNGLKASEKILTDMCRAIAHRGPDDKGVYCRENAGIGMQRLSIIDLAEGHQPIHNEDKSCWIVFNGEAYNFPALRKVLQKKGHSFYTRTDTEVVLHLYEEYGEDAFARIEGMFALCIWDTNQKRFLLARDKMGEKPLYYSFTQEKFIFSSEIKSILQHTEFEKEIDSHSLQKYLVYNFIPSPATIFKDIKRLKAGHYLILDLETKNLAIKPFWKPTFLPKNNWKNEDEAVKKLICLLQNSIEKRLISDVPLGVFLSGGIDSGLITSIMCQLIGPDRVEAFSIGFQENKYDETKYARAIAEDLKIRNHHVHIFSQRECLELIPEIISFLDEPMGDPSIIPTYLLSRFTRKHVKVALSGDGGDELFAGYPKYYAHGLAEKIPPILRNIFYGGNGKGGKLPFSFILGEKRARFLVGLGFPPHIRNQVWISPFLPEEVEAILGDSNNNIFEDIETHLLDFNGTDLVDKMLFLDSRLTFTDLFLVKVDRASMANSLEVRCPFLDTGVIELANQLPIRFKLQSRQIKYLLKKAAEKFIPREVIYRPKMGFGIPFSEWSRQELKPLILDNLSQKRIEQEGLFHYPYVKSMLSEHFQGQRNHYTKIWNLLVFQMWYKNWFEG